MNSRVGPHTGWALLGTGIALVFAMTILGFVLEKAPWSVRRVFEDVWWLPQVVQQVATPLAVAGGVTVLVRWLLLGRDGTGAPLSPETAAALAARIRPAPVWGLFLVGIALSVGAVAFQIALLTRFIDGLNGATTTLWTVMQLWFIVGAIVGAVGAGGVGVRLALLSMPAPLLPGQLPTGRG